MSERYFCDLCGVEVNEYVDQINISGDSAAKKGEFRLDISFTIHGPRRDATGRRIRGHACTNENWSKHEKNPASKAY